MRSRVIGVGWIAAMLCVSAMTTALGEAAVQVVINEVELNPAGRDAGNEWVELFNMSDVEVNLAGWSLTYTYPAPGIIAFSEGASTLRPGEFFVFTYPTLMLRNAERSIIELRDPDGNVVHSTSSLTDEENDGQTWQRFPIDADPLFGDLWLFREATKGNSIE